MKLRSVIGIVLLSMLALVALPVAAQPASNTVSFNGFSFTYDGSLAGHITISAFAGDPVTLDQPGGPEVKHTQFTLSEADTVPSIFDSAIGIRVYNTADFAAYPNQSTQLQKLQSLLANKTDLNFYMASGDPSAEGSLPFLPIMPASQVIRARAQYVSNQSVSGISYVTAYRQDVSPFLGNEFFYTFQGISVDGAHYVSAVFKLNTALFPAEIPADFNMDTFNAEFTDYIGKSISTLNNAQATDFTPSLATVDAVIQSLTFVSAVAAPPASPVTVDPTFGGLTAANWVLVSYGTAEAPIPALPEAPINLVFTAEGINGKSGCNQYFGQFRFEINQLSFNQIGSTLMACDQPVLDQEAAYLDALRTATGYTLANGVLTITYRDGVLTFNADSTGLNQATPTPVIGGGASLGGLAGVQWQLVSYGAVAVLPDAPVTIDFTLQGVSGNAGCNQYSGTFQYNDGSMTFSPLVATEKACAEPIMTQESAYLAALQSATGYQVTTGQLQINYPNGVLVFKSGT